MRLNRLNQLVRDGKTIDGVWRLASGQEVQYRRKGGEEEVLLSGRIIGTEHRGLLLRFSRQARDEDTHGRELSLRGRWQTDAGNRLSFLVERQEGREDRLKLEGGWEIGPGHELLYRLEREELKTKRKEVQTLRFSGFWDLGEDGRLVYLLEGNSDSALRLRGAFQSRSLLAKDGAIRYQLGAEMDGSRRAQTLTLFGRWKLSRRLGVTFEIPYRGGQARGVDFGAEFGLNPKGEVSCRLLSRQGKPLGLELLFTRSFFKGDGELFARLRRLTGETAVEAGVRLRW